MKIGLCVNFILNWICAIPSGFTVFIFLSMISGCTDLAIFFTTATYIRFTTMSFLFFSVEVHK